MKRVFFWLPALIVVVGLASPAWAAGLTLTIRDGRVSLDAQDVTIRQILTEWARVGKTRIVNLERVNSGPVTLKFDGLSETEALDVILRTLPGYMAAPRTALLADASIYDRIVILATTTAVAALPTARGQMPPFQDPFGNVTQLRQGPGLNPGVLPEPQDDPRNSNNPAIAAAAAAGLVAFPSGLPGFVGPVNMDPPMRNPNVPPPLTPLAPPERSPTAPRPSNPWNAPAGTSTPTIAPPVASPPTIPPPNPPNGGVRPQQADQ